MKEGEFSSSSFERAWTTGAFIDFLLLRKPRLPLPLSEEEVADMEGELSSLFDFGTSVKVLTSIIL